MMCLGYIEKSYALFLKNLHALVAGSFIMLLFIISMASLALALFFQNPLAVLSGDLNSASYGLNSPIMLAVGAIIIILAAALGISLQAGYYGMAMESVSRKTGLKSMAKFMRMKWRNAIFAFAMLILLYVSLFAVLFLIPASVAAYSSDYSLVTGAVIASIVVIFLVSVMFSFIYPAIISKKKAYESIVSSFNTAKSDYISVLAVVLFFFILSMVIRVAAGFIPLIGNAMGLLIVFAIVVPWESVAFSYMYQKMPRNKAK